MESLQSLDEFLDKFPEEPLYKTLEEELEGFLEKSMERNPWSNS